MRESYVLIIMFCILLINTASAVTISPSTIEINMIAGDTYIDTLNIKWSCKTATVAFIDTVIQPSSDGINVSYDNNPVILYSGNNKIIMTITTAVNLKPQIYTIITTATTTTETITKHKTRNIYINNEKILELEKEIEFLESKLENITILLENQKELCNDTIIQLEQDKEDLENYIAKLKEYILKFENEDDIDENSHFLVWLIIVLIFILFLSIAIVWLWNKNKNKKR